MTHSNPPHDGHSEIVNDARPGTGLNPTKGNEVPSQRAYGRFVSHVPGAPPPPPEQPDPLDEAAYARFMATAGLAPWQLISAAPVNPDPDELAYARFLAAAGGIPWSTYRP